MLNNINIIDKIRLPFRKEKELYSSLYRIIGFYPRNISYYKLALMHKSIMRRNSKGKPVNNERLEFLGDAILDAIVGHIVYDHFPGKREGFLTNTRSKLVQRDTLNKLAQEMGINRLILSNGRSSSHNSYMGGNAFEALVGAIYLDRGYDACMRFMNKRILAQMINIDKVAYKEVNFKSKLIEWSQKNRVRMEFKMLDQKKDKNGSPMFQYMVCLEGVDGCSGTGYSKKESQQLASKLTLERLKKHRNSSTKYSLRRPIVPKWKRNPWKMFPKQMQRTTLLSVVHRPMNVALKKKNTRMCLKKRYLQSRNRPQQTDTKLLMRRLRLPIRVMKMNLI